MNRYEQLPEGWITFINACKLFGVHRSLGQRMYKAGKFEHELCYIRGMGTKVCIVKLESFRQWEESRRRKPNTKRALRAYGAKCEFHRMLEACRENLKHPNPKIRSAAEWVLSKSCRSDGSHC